MLKYFSGIKGVFFIVGKASNLDHSWPDHIDT